MNKKEYAKNYISLIRKMSEANGLLSGLLINFEVTSNVVFTEKIISDAKNLINESIEDIENIEIQLLGEIDKEGIDNDLWIRSKDRLPENGEEIIFRLANETIYAGHFKIFPSGTAYFYPDCVYEINDIEVEDVESWIPLPNFLNGIE